MLSSKQSLENNTALISAWQIEEYVDYCETLK